MSELKYTEGHEWIRTEADGTVTVGITNYAQEQLGDVVYVELPEVGKVLQKGDNAAVIESVKTADEITAPLSGSVVAINAQLADSPEIVNSDPLDEGWFLQMDPEDLTELDACMDEEAYEAYIEGL
jgi:glycine cleavage system H protein